MQQEPLIAPTLTGRSIGNVKAHNLRALLLTLLRERAVSRVQLARLTGLSTTTVTNLVAELLEQRIVSEEGPEPNRASGAGRPPTLLQIVPGARCAVGVHIGVDSLRVGVTDLFGQLQHYQTVSHEPGAQPAEVLNRAVTMIEQALGDGPVDRGCLVGVGVGASGLVDVERGVNILAPNLGWREIPVHDILTDRLNLPVFVDNNVRAMALAEALFGVGRGVNTLAFVYARIGIGAGFVVGGQLYRGSRAGAGEIGHMTMIPSGGAPCRCGNTGCLETLVSEQEFIRQAQVLAERSPHTALARQLAEGDGPLIERIFAAARASDRDAQTMLNERAYYVGTALANIVNLVNPDMIILGGLLAAGQDLMLPMIEETMQRRSFAGMGHDVALRVTSFGRKVGTIGAAALALDRFFYQQEAR